MISGKHLTYKIYNVYALLLLNFALLLVNKTYTIQIITGFFDIDLLFWLAIEMYVSLAFGFTNFDPKV